MRALGAALLAGALGACQDSSQLSSGRAWRPISSEMQALFANKGTDAHQPTLIRTYKKEAEFEIWKMKGDGRYVHVKTFPMCRWSGQLGPKVREGDRQVPEGFYTITPGQMNPNSNYYLSFNVGYPNALDRAYGRDGGSIMVHGACSSAGCFSMTDAQIADIYAVARESFSGGQRAIQMESFPFRMTAENLAKHRLDPNIAFWRNLKEGSDNFEVTKQEPVVGACGKKYVFNTGASGLDAAAPCPALRPDPAVSELVAEKQAEDDAKVADLVAKGVQPVKVVYADGGQHPDFASRVSDVSRPDALATGATEIAMAEPKGKSNLLKVAGGKAAKARADLARLEPVRPAASDETIAAKAEEAAVSAAPPAASPATRLGSLMSFGRTEPKAAPEILEPVRADTTASVPTPPHRDGKPAHKPQAALGRNADGKRSSDKASPHAALDKSLNGANGADAKNFVALEPVRR